jgi:DNA mismatch repair protein MutS2
MAQAGFLIPADKGSKLGVFRGVFADIGDEQSIESSLSSFAAHIVNLTEITASLRAPALVILDEPGGGTDPVEGAALAIGLMDYLGAHGCIVAIATHSTAVKLHAYSRAGFEAAAVDFDADRLTPLYRLKPHTIGQSYGLAVARRLGLPGEIVSAAEATLPAGSAELAQALNRLEAERARIRAQADRLHEREEELDEREREMARSADRARARADSERERVRGEGLSVIEELRREGSSVLAEIKSGSKGKRELSRTLSESIGKLDRVVPPREDAPEAEPLKVGDAVEFGDIRGELIALEPGRAVVSRGGLRIEIAPERLRRARAIAPPSREPKVTITVAVSERDELNLIGMRTGDALRKLEEFLDQAYLTNRAEVRIVHGIGSGALKKAVHEYLGTSPYCAAFRQAEPHHGGSGATIVQLSL